MTPSVRRVSALALVGLSLATIVALLAPVPAIVRGALTLTFVVLGPGWAVVALARLTDLGTELIAAVATSISLLLIIGAAEVATNHWHPGPTVLVLAIVTIPVFAVHYYRPTSPNEPLESRR